MQEFRGYESIEWLGDRYHGDQPDLLKLVTDQSPEELLRLFVISHGMKPVGTWQTHTYSRFTDSVTGRDHFFLIPMPYRNRNRTTQERPNIEVIEKTIFIDGMRTPIRLQSIPYTTPFWYFHYNPNLEDRPYRSMALNLSPYCGEGCPICAGAMTGRVNSGQNFTLSPETVLEGIFEQHPKAHSQVEIVAVVTGCFADFNTLVTHLQEVKAAALKRCAAHTFRVLEHGIDTEERIELVVGELGYDIYVTLECYDPELRRIALNGKRGRKGRAREKFLELIKVYANYLDSHPRDKENFVRVTYLMGLDVLETSAEFFQELAMVNQGLRRTTVLPWVSIFTPYSDGMRKLQRSDFSLEFLLRAQKLCQEYFAPVLLAEKSGGTGQGYARGLF